MAWLCVADIAVSDCDTRKEVQGISQIGSKWTVVKGKKSDVNETKQALTEVKM